MFPEFFAAAPVIRTHDALARLLGAADGGLLEYRYQDAVRLAGHSCPTVAGAFLATRRALAFLYPDEMARRGEIRLELAGPPEAGVSGVIAAVAGLITGAAAEGGFAGLGGRHARRHLLRFNQPLPPRRLRFVRTDNKAAVEVALELASVPADPRLGGLLTACLANQADHGEQQLFAELWQARVRRLLVEHADDAAVFPLYPVEAGR